MNNKQKDKEKNMNINKRKTKEKKRSKKGKRILIVIIILILLAGGWFGYRIYKNGGGLSGFLAAAVGHDENTKKNLQEFRTLILGVSTDLDSQLTDTIMVASYNPNTQKANLLSIPRDTFTGKNKNKAVASQKINALYNLNKNPEKTLKAVNELTGLNITNYVVVKTEALIKLVDALGGVEFNVPINMNYDDPTQNLHIHLTAGTQKIDGEKAEWLLRFRHNNNGTSYSTEYGDNDFGRMRTQRDFITEVLKQTLKPGNIFKLGEILEIAHKNVETNMELSYIKDYIPYAVEFNTENLQTATIPGTTPNLSETNNISIFVADKKATTELIQSMFYGDTSEKDEETEGTQANTIAENTNTNSQIKIELLNGSGDKGKLQSAKEILEEAGYKVSKTGNTSTISKTIITNKKSVTEDKLKDIKQKLGVGSISTNKSSTSLVNISIIIGKDFE